MPYTHAHIAAVFPLWALLRRITIPSALVMGSIAPDLHYLLLFSIPREFTHSYQYFLVFALPVGLACFFLFNNLCRETVIDLLPESLRRRLLDFRAPLRFRGSAAVGRLLLSITIGALVHVWWDMQIWVYGEHWGIYSDLYALNTVIATIFLLAGLFWVLRRRPLPPADAYVPLCAARRKRLWRRLALVGVIGGLVVAEFVAFTMRPTLFFNGLYVGVGLSIGLQVLLLAIRRRTGADPFLETR